MSTLSTVITELLFERDSVIVPGLGMFVRQSEGAKVNVITNRFERPSSFISFDTQQRGEDGILVKALAASEGCSIEEAQQTLNHFVADCFADLKEGKEVTFPGLGTLVMDENATLSFEADLKANFNGDAFGLDDFNPVPVYDGKNSDDWKAQVAQRNKDMRTPMTVDRKALDSDEDDEKLYHRRHRRRVILSVLGFLLVIPVVMILLFFLEVIDLNLPFKPKPKPIPTIPVQYDTSLLSQMTNYYPAPVAAIDTCLASDSISVTDSVQSIDTTIVNPVVEPVVEPVSEPAVEPKKEPVVKAPERPLVSIIGGCFSQQENAEKLVASLQEEGYSSASVMKRGGMYYVCYGRYETLEEAKVALVEVKANSNSKAWILNK